MLPSGAPRGDSVHEQGGTQARGPRSTFVNGSNYKKSKEPPERHRSDWIILDHFEP